MQKLSPCRASFESSDSAPPSSHQNPHPGSILIPKRMNSLRHLSLHHKSSGVICQRGSIRGGQRRRLRFLAGTPWTRGEGCPEQEGEASSQKTHGSQETTEGRKLLPGISNQAPGGLAACRINAKPGGWETSAPLGRERKRRMSAGVLPARRQRAPSSTPAGMSWTPTAAQQTMPISSRPRTSFLIQDILWDGAERGAWPERGENGEFGSQEDGEPGAAAAKGNEGSSALGAAPGHPPGGPHPPGASPAQTRGTAHEADAGKGVENSWLSPLAGERISNVYAWVNRGGRILTRLPRAPQSQITRVLNTRECLCFSSGKVREIATACKSFARRFKYFEGLNLAI